jgi:uncharacterized DUF497 family protein
MEPRLYWPSGATTGNGIVTIQKQVVMEFEYDPVKSSANQEKHGIDFEAARALWDDDDRAEIPARTEDEPRYLVIDKIGAVVYSAVITYRGNRIRLISVRRARKEEVAIYEG